MMMQVDGIFGEKCCLLCKTGTINAYGKVHFQLYPFCE
jgi:hypothetical protein